MTVSDGYLTYVLDQLRPIVPGIRVKRMFGAVGLYATDLFFAIVDDDVLYLKVDDTTRPEYEARGMPPFRPFELHASMNYSQLPEEIFEEREMLRLWTGRALDVARAAKRSRATGKKTSKRSTLNRATKRRAAKKSAGKQSAGKKGTAGKGKGKSTAGKKSATKRRRS
jgi:DNA transformation protein and related proteins